MNRMSQESSNESFVNIKSFHLAGIVPVAGQPLDYKLPWHDCLQPIAQNFLAVERAVLECATAGCETIWIVCPAKMQPLIKHRLGEMVEDPVWIGRKFDYYPSESKKAVPIYYVETHPKDQGRKDSIVWSIIYGAKVATKVCYQLSKWVEPDKFYVAFPYGVFPSQHVRQHREIISKPGNFLLVTPEGNSVIDNEFIGFAFDATDTTKFSQLFWRKSTGLYDPEGPLREGKYPTERLPLKERYSGRHFGLKDIFGSIDTSKPTTWIEMEWFYDISSWEGYCKYIGSEHRERMKRPKSDMLRYRTWNKVGIDETD